MKKLFWNRVIAVLALGLVLGAGGFLLTGCQTYNDNIKFSPVDDPDLVGFVGATNESARFAVGDPLQVVLSGIDNAPPPHEEQIKEDGNITMPYIGAVKAEGKTSGELQKEIHDRYVPDYYKRLTVTVSTTRRVYYVQGQVRMSGRQEYIGPTTVLKAVATAGDFTDFANRRKVVLTRADGTRIIVDCIKAARDATYDLPVFPGDKIEVPMRGL